MNSYSATHDETDLPRRSVSPRRDRTRTVNLEGAPEWRSAQEPGVSRRRRLALKKVGTFAVDGECNRQEQVHETEWQSMTQGRNWRFLRPSVVVGSGCLFTNPVRSRLPAIHRVLVRSRDVIGSGALEKVEASSRRDVKRLAELQRCQHAGLTWGGERTAD